MSALPLSVQHLLSALPKPRLVDMGREFGVRVAKPNGVPATESVAHLVQSGQLVFRDLVEWMRCDELMQVCKSHGLKPPQRSRKAMSELLLDAHRTETVRPASSFGELGPQRLVPEANDVARVRQRQYLVTSVDRPQHARQLTRVDLVCLDDDQPGRALSVLWELELGARVYRREEPLRQFEGVDPPRHFAAYLHALQWSCVSVADEKRLQSPFRAGIKLLNHQLTPLLRALAQPRCKLFIADDVGLGKTIEAGLVLQEFELRQRVEFTLIVCPAAICLQWQREMDRRFGQRFEIYDREFVRQRRRERGFGVNPWATQQRFIVSYQTLRREEHCEPLLQCLRRANGGAPGAGSPLAKSMLVLDEAHTVAPSAKGYEGSGLTQLAAELSPLFEHHLFLSATPHNGYSESFSALLKLLDSERFSERKVLAADDAALESVMVRRLKRDLVQLDRPARGGAAKHRKQTLPSVTGQQFPDRHVVKIAIRVQEKALLAQFDRQRELSIGKCTAELPELELSRLLEAYRSELSAQGQRGRRTLGNLQKRLLSSLPAFATTLDCHIKSLRNRFGAAVVPEELSASAGPGARRGRRSNGVQVANDVEPDVDVAPDPEAARDVAEDVWDRAFDAEVLANTAHLAAPSPRAIELVRAMRTRVQRSKAGPDAKVQVLVHWLREHLCPGIALGGPTRGSQDRSWSDERVIIFTEYTTTKNWLKNILAEAIDGTEQSDDRIQEFHGAMEDRQREYVQKSFNGDPAEHPVRILLATDAAREGLNLHKHCKYLFHFDIPWNPARLEQRNGRIDRAFQPSPEVWCHYFTYTERTADAVLDRVIQKLKRTAEELPGLADVLAQRLGAALENGIDEEAGRAVDAARVTEEEAERQGRELEQHRRREAQLRTDIDAAAEAINESAKVMRYSERALRDALNVGLEMCGLNALRRLSSRKNKGARDVETYELPAMPHTWERTLDALREPRKDDEPLWRWRRRPLQPVVFSAPESIDEDRVQLHLRHPFVQRVLSRFLAQGFSAHDLHRVTVLPNDGDARVLVIVFARATLFANDATRLHDEVFGIAARWRDAQGTGSLEVLPEAERDRVVETAQRLLDSSGDLPDVPEAVIERVRDRAGDDLGRLWRDVEDRYQWLISPPKKRLQVRKPSEPLRPSRTGAVTEIPRSERGPRERLAQVGLVYLWPTTRL